MIHCHLCQETLEVGDAMIPERIHGSPHSWYFCPGCHAKWVEEREKTERRLQNVRRLAGYTH